MMPQAIQLETQAKQEGLAKLHVQPLQETIQRGEIGHVGESERLTQFAMLPGPRLGFAKSPILVAHQTEDRRQLGLRGLVFAETAAVGGSTALATCRAMRAKGRSPTSTIELLVSQANNDSQDFAIVNSLSCSKDVNRAE